MQVVHRAVGRHQVEPSDRIGDLLPGRVGIEPARVEAWARLARHRPAGAHERKSQSSPAGRRRPGCSRTTQRPFPVRPSATTRRAPTTVGGCARSCPTTPRRRPCERQAPRARWHSASRRRVPRVVLLVRRHSGRRAVGHAEAAEQPPHDAGVAIEPEPAIAVLRIWHRSGAAMRSSSAPTSHTIRVWLSTPRRSSSLSIQRRSPMSRRFAMTPGMLSSANPSSAWALSSSSMTLTRVRPGRRSRRRARAGPGRARPGARPTR